MRPSSRRFQSVLVHLLIGGALTLLIAALFVSPERLRLSAAGAVLAPAHSITHCFATLASSRYGAASICQSPSC
jgi:hypothetical protein